MAHLDLGPVASHSVNVDRRSTNPLAEKAVVAPGATTWRTGRNIRVVFDCGPFSVLCDT